MSSRSLVRSPVSCSAVNECFSYNSRRPRSYYQYSNTMKLQTPQAGQMLLPRKLWKSTRLQTTLLIQRRTVSNCCSDLSTTYTEQLPSYLTLNVLQDQSNVKQNNIRKVLVILNPNSGFRSSREVYFKKVQSTLKLSGFAIEVVETAYAGHAKVLASTVDLSTCPDGIICVGGDGVVNEVVNGLLGRDDLKEALQLPIGIVPAGSDNSLVWSVLGIRDPVSAATALAKGGFTPIDVFAVKWIQAGVTHFGLTASYCGFVADVLQLSEKFRLQLGPFRYVIAGILKFLSLPQYKFEVDYLPLSPEKNPNLEPLIEKCHDQLSDGSKVKSGTCMDSSTGDNWVTRKGEFLGILVCNHFCRPAQVVVTAFALVFLSLASLSIYCFIRRRRRRRRQQSLLAADAGTANPGVQGDGPAMAGDATVTATDVEGGAPDPGDEEVVHHAWHIRTVGLDEAAIESIALTRYRAGAGTPGGAADCSVCLGEFLDGEFLRLLPKCGHAFHVPCIGTWLRAHVNCPLCRADVVVLDSAATGGSDPPTDDAHQVPSSTETLNHERPGPAQRQNEQQELRVQIDPCSRSRSPEPPRRRMQNFRRVASMDSSVVSARAGLVPQDKRSRTENQGNGEVPSGSGRLRCLSGGGRWSLLSRHRRTSSSVLPS